MGKWTAYKNKLDPFQQEPAYQDKVNEAKSAFQAMTASELGRAFSITRNEKRELEAQVKVYSVELEALSQLLVEHLEANKLSKIGLDSGECIFIASEPYAQVEDREKCMAWIETKGLQALLTPHWRSLNALIKEQLINGEPIMSGVKVYFKVAARITGGNREVEE